MAKGRVSWKPKRTLETAIARMTETEVEKPLTRLSQYLSTRETHSPAAAFVPTMTSTSGA